MDPHNSNMFSNQLSNEYQHKSRKRITNIKASDIYEGQNVHNFGILHDHDINNRQNNDQVKCMTEMNYKVIQISIEPPFKFE